MTTKQDVEILVIGAGLAGIATAYYLCTLHHKKSVLLVDPRPPMSYTTAQSGDNYRNWWPHPTMAEFTNYSIDLMEQIAGATSNVFNMHRRGYLLATRRHEIDGLISDLHTSYGSSGSGLVRTHSAASTSAYIPPDSANWQTAPDGVDVLSSQELIRETFPSLGRDVANVIHIRRAGDISGQQLGQYMLERIRAAGGKRLAGSVRSIEAGRRFSIDVDSGGKTSTVRSDIVVNAAGPFAAQVGAMLGAKLPIENVYQQKIAFEDKRGVVPRTLPFTIDLDGVELDWSDEERALLAEDPDTSWLTGRLPGGVHCRPEGGDAGAWVKLGWAYNNEASEPQEDLANEPLMDPQYPEIVVRAATRLQPSLGIYTEHFPERYSHYGGYYPMTRENWPLVGPMGMEGAFMTGALSGFGSMAACAAGAICASWISGAELPHYAQQLSMARYADADLMAELGGASSRGIL